MKQVEVASTSIKTEYFGSLTERMNKYREDVLNKKPYIDAERAVLATKAYDRYKEQPNVLKRAYMLKEILENMTIYIEDESMIAGNQASSNKDAPIFPEYTLEFVLKELDLFEKRDGDVFYITEETKEQLRSIAPFWENNNLRARAGALLPEEVSVYMETGFFGMEGKMNSGDAHLAVNYQKLLQYGLKGFEERARQAKAALDLTDPASIDKYHFYDSIFIVVDAVKTYAQRFVELAKQLAETATPERKKELLEIAEICSKVPYEPASTFAEAVQSVWFIQCILQIESNGHSLSYGRFDQYMYPYVKADLESGRETEESIVERLTNLWIKTITINKVRSQAHTFSSAGSPLPMSNFNSQKIIAPIMRFVNMKGIIALKDGMLAILPLTVVGSLFLIIGQLPFEGLNQAIASVFGDTWTEPFMQVYSGTFAIMGLISCFSIGYSYAKNSGVEPLPAGVLSLSSFFILLKSSYVPAKGEPIGDAIAKVWFGGQGIIGAIIIGLVVGAIYTVFIQRHIVIKMPEQVPQAIAKQFEAMIPAFVIFLLSMIVYIVSKVVTSGGTFIEMIYDVIQVPLQGLTGSLYGAIGIAFFISFLWWFGVHGQSVVNGVVTALLLSNLDANKSMLAAGKLSVENGAHIVTQQFLDSFLILSGSGITFGLVIAMLFAAKSKQYKALGKVAAFPAIFNVNEPVVFGFPIVMNPVMFLPFIIVPILAAIIVYTSIAIGFMHPFSGVTLPWSTPAIISGFMVGGWQGAFVQVLVLATSTVVYFPFFKFQDNLAYNNELQAEK